MAPARCRRSAGTGRRNSSTRRSPTFSSASSKERAVAARAERPPLSLVVSQGRVSSWLTTVDHKRIGILYILTSLAFFLAGGVLALLMRAQLATPGESVVTRNSYNELFTMHGTTMVFLVVVPVWAGFRHLPLPPL